MTITDLSVVADQIQEFWGTLMTAELRNSLLLGSFVNRDYDGIAQYGNTVRISSISAPAGSLLTCGADADTFDSEALSLSHVHLVINKRAVSAVEIAELADLQSQLGQQDSEIRAAMLYAVQKQINTYLYSLISPSATAPDHQVSGVTDFNAGQIASVRTLAATAKWPQAKPWIILAAPSYIADILNSSTLTSNDYVDDKPIVGGIMGMKRFGFNIFEDNSLPTDTAYAFYSDFMHLAIQKEITFKLSDLHAKKQFAYLLSADTVFGAVAGIGHSVKVIKIYNS